MNLPTVSARARVRAHHSAKVFCPWFFFHYHGIGMTLRLINRVQSRQQTIKWWIAWQSHGTTQIRAFRTCHDKYTLRGYAVQYLMYSALILWALPPIEPHTEWNAAWSRYAYSNLFLENHWSGRTSSAHADCSLWNKTQFYIINLIFSSFLFFSISSWFQ